MKTKNFLFLFLFFTSIILNAQFKDTVNLNEISISTYQQMNGIGRMDDQAGEIIYAGKKTEVLVIDSLDANKAINNTRYRWCYRRKSSTTICFC